MTRTAVWLATGIIWVGLTALVRAESPDLWVAAGGNDSWSGRLAEPNVQQSDGPFASIRRAQRAVRELRQAEPQRRRPIQVAISGVVRLSQPIVLQPDDSGTADCPVVYQGRPGPAAVISGGRRIDGWKKGPGQLWTAEIPEVKAGRWYFRQLFIDGRRACRARSPNAGYLHVAGLVDAPAKAEWNQGIDRFRFRPGDVLPWHDLHEVEVVVFHSWNTSRVRIAAVDTERSVVTFTGPTVFRPLAWDPQQRYYVENARELLDQPGQWYLDRASGVLSYWPLPDEDMTKVEAIAPALTELVRLEGDPDKGRFVDYVTLAGLRLEHADWSLPERGYGDPQAAVTIPAAVMARGARHCRIDRCEIAHVGNYGIWLGRGCQHDEITMNHVHNLGAGAIRIGEPVLPPSDAVAASHIRVRNNYLHDGCHVYAGAVGLWLAQSFDNEVSHNEIHSFDYSGMSIGWNWDESPNRTHHNRIEQNHIHHCVRGMLSDAGGIYTLGVQTGTVLRGNLIHDIFPYSGNPSMAWGLYFDQGSSGITAEENIVYHTLTGGIMNTGQSGNVVRNNVFALSAQQAAWRYTYQHDPPSIVERNIFYLTQGELFHADGGSQDRRTRFDRNLYWRTDGQPLLFYDDDFAGWQAKGLDRGGLVADPRFVDPLRGDFRLRADSPAWKLGFRPIDMSRCGLEGPAEWVSLPQRATFAPTVLPPALSAAGTPVDDGFEQTAIGQLPSGATVIEEGHGDSIRVTDEAAASGQRSLKFTDAPGLKHAFNPHLYYSPHFRTGRARLSFDLRLGVGAIVGHEWRDASQPYRVGPSLLIDARGRLTASGKPLGDLPHDVWVRFEVVCRLGPKPPGTYDLTVTLPSNVVLKQTLACGSPNFSRLEWLGFTSLADGTSVFFLDNVRLGLE